MQSTQSKLTIAKSGGVRANRHDLKSLMSQQCKTWTSTGARMSPGYLGYLLVQNLT